MHIRLATEEDAELIADLSRSTFYETFAAHNIPENMEKFMNEQFKKEKLVAEVYDPWNIFILAYDDNEIAGYAKMRSGFNPGPSENLPEIEIQRIYSVTKKLGKGVGKLLMQHCLEIAKERNNNTIWLGVWEHNKRAIDFYTKWGFVKFGEHEFILGDDVQTDWLMKKHI